MLPVGGELEVRFDSEHYYCPDGHMGWSGPAEDRLRRGRYRPPTSWREPQLERPRTRHHVPGWTFFPSLDPAVKLARPNISQEHCRRFCSAERRAEHAIRPGVFAQKPTCQLQLFSTCRRPAGRLLLAFHRLGKRSGAARRPRWIRGVRKCLRIGIRTAERSREKDEAEANFAEHRSSFAAGRSARRSPDLHSIRPIHRDVSIPMAAGRHLCQVGLNFEIAATIASFRGGRGEEPPTALQRCSSSIWPNQDHFVGRPGFLEICVGFSEEDRFWHHRSGSRRSLWGRRRIGGGELLGAEHRCDDRRQQQFRTLEAESSTCKTGCGSIWTPQFRNISRVSINYFDIEVHDDEARLGAGDDFQLFSCYKDAAFLPGADPALRTSSSAGGTSVAVSEHQEQVPQLVGRRPDRQGLRCRGAISIGPSLAGGLAIRDSGAWLGGRETSGLLWRGSRQERTLNSLVGESQWVQAPGA